MKTRLLIVLSVLMVASMLLAACSGSGAAPASSTPTLSVEEQVAATVAAKEGGQQPTPTLSVEEQVAATVAALGNGDSDETDDPTPMPTATLRPTQTALPTQPVVVQPTATRQPTEEVSPDQHYINLVKWLIPDEPTLKVTQTPVPGAGPYEDKKIPLVPASFSDENDAFDFLRGIARAYRIVMLERGEDPTLYGFMNDVIPGVFAKEWQATGCTVQTDGGLWVNANLEDCGGAHLTVTDGKAFVITEFGDLRVDNSNVNKTPFWPGSHLGGSGAWLIDGEANLTVGLIYIPNGTQYTIEPAVLK